MTSIHLSIRGEGSSSVSLQKVSSLFSLSKVIFGEFFLIRCEVKAGPQLVHIFNSKGGVKGKKIMDVLVIHTLCDNINTKRERILRSLVIDLNEDQDSFFKEYLASAPEDAERDIANTVMGIYTIRRNGEPEDVGIVMEGIKVMNNVDSVIMAFIMLFGLIYALDLSFPEHLKYSFEFLQKIIMNLDGHKLNSKILQLKIKLFA